MHCEQAVALISARIDREITPDEATALDEHLALCPACQATVEAFNLQDQELRQTFEPRRAAVVRVARAVTEQLEPSPMKTPPRRWMSRVVLGLTTLAACVAGVLLYRHVTIPPTEIGPDPSRSEPTRLATLTPRPLPESRKPTLLQVGETLTTGVAERTRRLLPDGSVLYVDRATEARLTEPRTVQVSRGNVYVEVAPNAGAPFRVGTPTREVVAEGTRFEVQVAEKGTGVVVTQGKVRVGNMGAFVVAGQKLAPGADTIEAAPRTSHLLDWTRDLMGEATAALVPASQYQGGSLVAYDTNGQEAKLSLRNYHVDVHIEDGFARTTIDQTYFNHHPWRLEGTFHFPLPPDASLSQLTMYVNGERQEGGMVERQQGRTIYNKIVNSMRDPALLEWVDGTTFKMRVFPLEGRQEKRILLSYTQRLPSLYGQTTYRFPSGHSLRTVQTWSFHARIKDGKGTTVVSPTHPGLVGADDHRDLLLTATEKNVKVDKDVVLHLSRGGEPARETVDFRHADSQGQRYLMTRFRPELPSAMTRQRRDWVFLYEASADRDPLLARVQIEVFRHLLGQAEHDDTFTLLVANSRIHFFAKLGARSTSENIARAVAWLEKVHLVGALDLGQAFDHLSASLNNLANPHLVHLGSGLPGIGRKHERLKEMLPPQTRYLGIGIGKRWARSFMKELAEKTGGLYTQINPDEQVAWRAFELLATLNTPRLLDVRASFEGEDAPRALVDQALLAQGEELCISTRVPLVAGIAKLPTRLVLTGILDGQPYRRVIDVQEGSGNAGYLPRTWARLEIDRLLADSDTDNKQAIITLSKDSYVMTPYTSLLVLENAAMYREFKVEQGRKDHWAAFPGPDRIPVVYEPDPTQPGDVANAPRDRKPGKAEVLASLLVHVPARFLHASGQAPGGNQLTTALDLYRGAFMEPLTPDEIPRTRFVESATPEIFDRMKRVEPAVDDLRATRNLYVLDGPAFGSGRQSGRLSLLAGDMGALAFSPDGTMLAISESKSRIGSPTRPRSARTRLENGRGTFERNLWDDFAPVELRLLNRTSRSDADGLQFDFQSRFYHFNGVLRQQEVLDAEKQLHDPEPNFALAATRLGEIDTLIASARVPGALHYPRLHAAANHRLRDDLFAYAPGLNTNAADIEAVLEAEAEPELRNVPGRIAPEALALIEAARRGGWTRLQPADKDAPEILFDASGRFVVTRVLPIGLREETLHDGKTLLSLYPEIGLAAQRTPSRHHRAEIVAGLPHVVAPAADLARGHDLELVATRTVAVIPHNVGDKTHLRRLFIFAENGQLVERQVVRMPGAKVLLRQTLLADGVRVADADDKELSRLKFTLTPVESPDLTRDLSTLVVLEPPYRNRPVLARQLHLFAEDLNDGANGSYRHLPRQEAVQLLAHACLTRHTSDARRVLRHCFLDRDDTRPGLLVLLALAEIRVGQESWFARFAEEHSTAPLVRYFAVMQNPVFADLRPVWPMNLTRGIGPEKSFLVRLARFHELDARWQNANPSLLWDFTRRTHLADTLRFFREQPTSILAQTLLVRMQDHGRLPEGGWRELAAARDQVTTPAERYRNQYERAACLWQAGDHDQARTIFREVADQALGNGLLPLLDERFVTALTQPGPKDPWTAWVLTTAERLARDGKYLAILDLATRCRELGDPALAENLLIRVLAGGKEAGRTFLLAAVVVRLLEWNQPEMADVHLRELLQTESLREFPWLYRLACRVAEARGHSARQFELLDQALELEAKNLPDVIDLEARRQDYRPLFEHYLERARVLHDLGKQADQMARQALIARTVHALDRFRAHDPESAGDCQKGARILQLLGADALAWDYQTTPHAGRDEPGDTHSEAVGLARAGAHDLAERLFRVACEANPERAHLWWDRARALQAAGQDSEARAIFQGLARGQLAPEDRIYRERAAWFLKAR